jgi:hypothetical protein
MNKIAIIGLIVIAAIVAALYFIYSRGVGIVSAKEPTSEGVSEEPAITTNAATDDLTTELSDGVIPPNAALSESLPSIQGTTTTNLGTERGIEQPPAAVVAIATQILSAPIGTYEDPKLLTKAFTILNPPPVQTFGGGNAPADVFAVWQNANPGAELRIETRPEGSYSVSALNYDLVSPAGWGGSLGGDIYGTRMYRPEGGYYTGGTFWQGAVQPTLPPKVYPVFNTPEWWAWYAEEQKLTGGA